MKQGTKILDDLYALAKDRRQNRVVASYTNYLQDRGSDYITRKVGEESLELVLALKDENKDHIIHETADVLYHITIALENLGIKWSEISEELEIRRKNDNDIHTIKDESEF